MKLEFTPEALEEIAQLAVDRKIGARGLRSIMEERDDGSDVRDSLG